MSYSIQVSNLSGVNMCIHAIYFDDNVFSQNSASDVRFFCNVQRKVL